jgi:hypothetical protein
VTIICALKDGDNLYIASDSAVGGLPTKAKTDRKINSVNHPPLAWGTAGDEAIGDLFEAWFRQQLASAKPEQLAWAAIIGPIVLRLAELNGIRTQASQLNKVRLEPERDLCQVLLVGYIAGQPEIVHLEVNGDWTMHVAAGRAFAAAGAGAHHAAMAYEVLKEKGLLPSDGTSTIREIAELTARHAPGCEPPVHIFKVAPDRVQKIE